MGKIIRLKLTKEQKERLKELDKKAYERLSRVHEKCATDTEEQKPAQRAFKDIERRVAAGEKVTISKALPNTQKTTKKSWLRRVINWLNGARSE